MKISVLVPTLGTREKEIRRLLETLEKQSYKDFEIIFVILQLKNDHIVTNRTSHEYCKISYNA